MISAPKVFSVLKKYRLYSNFVGVGHKLSQIYIKLFGCEVDVGIKHPCYQCLRCFHLKGQYRHDQQGMESER